MSGELAAARAGRAEAEAAERVKLAERWIALPRDPILYLHAVTAEGVWYYRVLANGNQSHGLAPWVDVVRELGGKA